MNNEETVIEEHVESEIVKDAETDVVEEHSAETKTEEVDAPLTLEEQLKAVQDEASDYKDRWMRSQAEFVNARKRMEKQRAQTYQNAMADVIGKVVPALDDFERALQNVPTEISENVWFEGIQLVERKLAGMLDGLSVLPIEAVGQPFDPNFHEAITQEPSDEFESGVVTRELQKGYKLGDRVIRPSLVCVAA
ncbi:MAG: nucleotide exchange factor GrpE [Chloroflexi bacterium]|nr:nucleotide exchange factor GrpE [Chloroflexota bacterium]